MKRKLPGAALLASTALADLSPTFAGEAPYDASAKYIPASSHVGDESTSAIPTPTVLKEIAQVEAEIDKIESQTLDRLAAAPNNQVQEIELLGNALLYDKELSVNRNEPCTFCHMPGAGFTGSISELNRTTRSYPGSVRTRYSERKPQTHSYALLSPILHYNSGQGDLVGGNFWDMRATGPRLGNPAAEQAEGPPANPVEIGLPDIACAVYRVSQRPYRALFERVWGAQAFAVAWPGDAEQICNKPGPPSPDDLTAVHLNAGDRGGISTTFDQMAQSIAGYEASAEVTAFTSKFDAVLAGKAQFTPQEQEGYALFRGKAQCNSCYRGGGPGEDPLFTDFTASNIGTPPIPRLPYYIEDRSDSPGYVANPDGRSFTDGGLGSFLAKGHPPSQPSVPDARWVPLAPQNIGRVQMPTLRNVDKRPYPDFVKAYDHNGYFKSLKEIVHFYNTRDIFPRCQPNDPCEGVSCCPAPESTANMNTSKVGHLGLTDTEEDAVVSFMQTLADGYMPSDGK